MALDSCSDCCVFPPLDLDRELRTLGVGVGVGDGAQEDGIHGAFFPAMLGVESPVSSEASTGGGYLEDAVAHWSDRCKRQRMTVAAVAATPPPPRRPATANEDLQCLLQSFWDSSSGEGDLLHDLNIMIPETSSFASEEEDASGKEQEQEQEQGGGGPSAKAAAASQGGGDAEAAGPPPVSASPSRATGQTQAQTQAAPAGTLRLRLQKATTGAAARRRSGSGSGCCVLSGSGGGAASASSCCSSLAGKENRSVGVLYPFAVVKPLGLDGGGTTTLNDVNQRILKPPARPVRHPVGPFACSPAVSAHGLGLSGKAVVSLTRIRTGGKGTITIIRTTG